MSRVFVIQESKFNIAPALMFGDIVVMLPPYDANFSAQATLERLEEKLRDFDPDDDWLLLIGDPAAIAMAGALIADKHYFLRMLKWDRQEQKYLPIQVEL